MGLVTIIPPQFTVPKNDKSNFFIIERHTNIDIQLSKIHDFVAPMRREFNQYLNL